MRTAIAVIGVACRLPGDCFSLSSMWELLCRGGETVTPIPEDRWSSAWYGGPKVRLSKTVAHAGSFLRDLGGFDAAYFGYSADDAASTDPTVRMILELSVEALEDAGVPLASLRGRDIGTYIGASTGDYGLLRVRELETSNQAATKPYYLANRIAHFLDARGPSVSVDTACSASLTAVHLACASLAAGECELALSGGAQLIFVPNVQVILSQLGALSPSGLCKPFDVAADGYGRAEGGGVVVLKRLEDALADGDRVYAVIRGTGICHGGQSPLGPWAPRHDQQAALFTKVLSEVGRSAEDVVYVEAHGTGTQVGDKEELLAMSQAYCRGRAVPLGFGSGKRTFNHSETAAGVTGLLKAIGILHYGAIPPTRVSGPRTDLSLAELGLRLVDAYEPLAVSPRSPLVAINSYGVAGAYAHALVEGPPARGSFQAMRDSGRAGAPRPMLLPVSAKSGPALKQRAAGLLEYVSAYPELAVQDLCHTLCRRRDHHDHRMALVAASHSELLEALRGASPPATAAPRRRELVFVFSGTGPQWWGMGRELLAGEPVFRSALERFDREWLDLDGWSLLAQMQASEQQTLIGRRTRHSTVAQVAIQAGLAELWISWGIAPDRVIGHSLGELAAAYTAGAISMRELATLAKVRCDWQDLFDGAGSMAAVGLDEAATRRYLEEHAPALDIAGLNSPAATTVSGDAEAIDRLCELLTKEGVFCRRLRVTVPFHSRHMRQRRAELAKLCPPIAPRPPRIPFVSTVYGGPCAVPLDMEYWVRGFTQPVLFQAALLTLLAGAETPNFLELGPHPVLATSVEECAQSRRPGAPVLTSLRRHEPERATLLRTLGKLYELGYTPDWDGMGAQSGQVLALPRYPWEHTPYWDETAASKRYRLQPPEHELLGTLIRDPQTKSRLIASKRVSPRLVPFLSSHRIGGQLLFPGAGYIEMLRAAAASSLGSAALELQEIRLEQALVLDAELSIDLRTVLDEHHRSIEIFSSADGGTAWVRHATCRFAELAAPAEDSFSRSGSEEPVDVEDYYRIKWAAGYHFGPHFRMLQTASRSGPVVAAAVALPEETAYDIVMARVLVIDGALQTASLARSRRYAGSLMLPHVITGFQVRGELAGGVQVAARERSARFATSCCDLAVYDAAGGAVATVSGYVVNAIPSPSGFSWDPQDWLCREELIDAPLASQPQAQVAVALVCDPASRWLALIDSLGAVGAASERHGSCEAALAWLSERRRQGDRAILVDTRWHDADPDADGQDAPVQHLLERAWAAVQVLQLAQSETAAGSKIEVIFVTGGAAAPGCAFAALASLRRVAEAEVPALRTKVVQLDAVALGSQLGSEILTADSETEVVWTGALRRAVRLRRVPRTDAADAPKDSETVSLGFTPPGEFVLVRERRKALGPTQVRIRPRFAGLNFRDVMKVLGIYPSEQGDRDAVRIGDEAMGVVSEVGAGVSDLAVGDRVMVRAGGGCVSNELCSPRAGVVRVPDSVSDAEASALPVVFSTAWYALRTLAGLARGERVLIHSAAGGVGLAAVQIAQACGAEIFATAGTEDKRAYLRTLGVPHVFSSKGVEFAAAIRELTGGQGVDVVLNSLAGASMVQSIAVLRDFGRFIELGKRDLYDNTPIGLFPFRRNLSYHAVDMAKLWACRPDVATAVLCRVAEAFGDGTLRPLPTTVFPASQVREAFAQFQRGTHIGKLVISCADVERADLPSKVPVAGYRSLVRAGASYLVTGGLGGMGLVMLKWLADAGATHLAVVNRSGPSAEARSCLDALSGRGVRVDLFTGSVADRPFLDSVVQKLRTAGAPLRGVIHTAGTLQDALLSRIARQDLEHVFGPKVQGSWNLHQATLAEELDFFILFSSSATLGSAGQAVYAMANGFLNWLAQKRLALGRPGQATGWGPYLGRGMMTEEQTARRLRGGVAGFTTEELTDLVDHVLPTFEPHVLVCIMDWAKFLEARTPKRFAELRRAEARAATQLSLREQLQQATPEAASALLIDYLRQTASRIRGVAYARITASDTLDTLGFDSLTLVSLVNRLSYDLAVAVAPFELGRDLTMEGIAEKLRAKTTPTRQQEELERPEHPVLVGLLPNQERILRCMDAPDDRSPFTQTLIGFDAEGPIDPRAVEEALRIIMRRHEGLRARFTRERAGWTMAILPEATIRVGRMAAHSERMHADYCVELATRTWNIEHEPMLRCAIIEHQGEQSQSVVLVIHHLVTDAASMNVLGDEFTLAYTLVVQGGEVRLPAVPTSGSQWQAAQAALADSGREQRLRAIVSELVARGRRPLDARLRVFAHSFPSAASPLSDGPQRKPQELLAEACGALLEVTGLSVVGALHSGRQTRLRDLSLTVGCLPLIELIRAGDSRAFRGEFDLGDGVALATVLRGLNDDELRAFFSQHATVVVQYFPALPARTTRLLKAWPAQRLTPILQRLSAELEPPKFPIATRLSLQIGQFRGIRALTCDPAFDQQMFDWLVERIAPCFSAR